MESLKAMFLVKKFSLIANTIISLSLNFLNFLSSIFNIKLNLQTQISRKIGQFITFFMHYY